MLSQSKPKKLGAPAAMGGTSKKFKHDLAVTVKTTDAEKPHKGSVSKAKKRAAKLKDGLLDEEQVTALVEAIPTASTQEKQHLDEYLHMFRKLKLLIRKAERTCLKDGANSREFYALCALYSQQREIIADIRSVTDLSGTVAAMDTNVIRPLVSAMGQNVLDSMFQIRKIILECGKEELIQAALFKLEGVTKEQGVFLQLQFGRSMDSATSLLLG